MSVAFVCVILNWVLHRWIVQNWRLMMRKIDKLPMTIRFVSDMLQANCPLNDAQIVNRARGLAGLVAEKCKNDHAENGNGQRKFDRGIRKFDGHARPGPVDNPWSNGGS